MTRLIFAFILGLTWTLAYCNRIDDLWSDNMYLVEKATGEPALVITRLENLDRIYGGCETFTDHDVIRHMLRPFETRNIRKLSQSQTAQLMRDCSLHLPLTSGFEAAERSEEVLRTNFLFPGTKWCGDDVRPDDYDELGYYVETDKCCREHKQCSGTILPGQTKFNLTNNSGRTRYSCECDEEFLQCISGVNTFASNYFAMIYFNSPTRKCYKEDYPTMCKKRREFFFTSICDEYGKDTSVPQSYMWVPVKKYNLFSIRW